MHASGVDRQDAFPAHAANAGLRLLHVIPSVDPALGGPCEGLRQHAALRARYGVRTTIATTHDDYAEVPGATVVRVARSRGFGFAPGLIARLRGLAQDHEVGVIHGLWMYHAWAAHRAFAGRLPYLLLPHGMLDPWFQRVSRLRALKKGVYWRLFEHQVVRDAAAVCFTSESERLLARTAFRPYAAREQSIRYGTAPPPPADPRQTAAFRACCPTLGDRPFLLFLARLHPKKGCDLLLEAFADELAPRLPELALVLAGPDPGGLLPGLMARAAQRGLGDRVVAPGMLTGDAKWGAFRAAEAFCLPSHQENFGIAVAEALACGTPVLISDQVGIWREIEADGAGLVGPDDRAGIAGLLRRWLAERGARERFSAAAVRCFAARFDVLGSVEDVLHLAVGVRDAWRVSRHVA